MALFSVLTSNSQRKGRKAIGWSRKNEVQYMISPGWHNAQVPFSGLWNYSDGLVTERASGPYKPAPIIPTVPFGGIPPIWINS